MGKHQVLRTLDTCILMINALTIYHPLPDPLPEVEDGVVTVGINSDPLPSDLLIGEDNANNNNINAYPHHDPHCGDEDKDGEKAYSGCNVQNRGDEVAEKMFLDNKLDKMSKKEFLLMLEKLILNFKLKGDKLGFVVDSVQVRRRNDNEVVD